MKKGLRRFVLALAMVGTCAPHAETSPLELDLRLPDMGDSSGAVISPEEERRLGEEVMRQIRTSLALLEDPESNAYLRALGYRLVSHSNGADQNFTFFVVRDGSINAFALPGGFVGIHTGLVEAAQSESELAAVLAHEISHVTQRHIARSIEASDKMSIPAQAAMIAAILIGIAGNAQVGNAAIAATQAGIVQSQIDFTRTNEYEADRVGMQLLSRSGLDPIGMPDFFERLGKATQFYGKAPEFLQTHPVTTNRIAEARARIGERPGPAGVGESLEYQLFRARLNALSVADPRQAVADFRRRLDEKLYRSEKATRYGYAVALLRSGQATKAKAELERLLAGDPDQPMFINAIATAELESGATEAATRRLKSAYRLYPGDYALGLTYADALLKGSQPQEARRLLLELERDNHTPDLYRRLATAADRAGYPAEALRHMAEYQHLTGDTTTAVGLLERAVKAPGGDFYERSQAQARLEEYKQVLSDLKKPGDKKH